MTTVVPAWSAEVVAELPYPVIFATVSGAHLYGFASVDSDLDLRAAHLLPVSELVGLRLGPETLSTSGWRDGVELDVVSHDLRKFARLLNSRNGYVLEQLLSPLVVTTGPLHATLIELAPSFITSGHAQHYLGFAASQQRLFDKTGSLKSALYWLRVLLTGQHLMRTGELETDLAVLGTSLPYVPELIALKRSAEKGPFPAALEQALRTDTAALRTALEEARDTSPLPPYPDPAAVDALHEIIVETRLATPKQA
ncbi:nucleotidyltransferase domain-containing protein [Paractinoplanes hotanensis]|uniref:Nucleotidyltransferase domain-containing protein n=1 Tax=Paractinoplanes hotanensis TaxID=2906497 RepID=A0ABT0Y295_9ACTN|nr:nucleotidyltransferase domain-containing protein [Actinoplanes hotanensis]MCM4080152.1 nucleotidyltransferase domain-containing protein [Actinoplanes hotanensis]